MRRSRKPWATDVPQVAFSELPDHGRLWVFPISRGLTQPEAELCLDVVDRFLVQWAAHGSRLQAGRELVEERFLLIGVDVDAEAPSGCSVDELMRELRKLGTNLDATFLDYAPVWFRADDGIRSVSRKAFRALAEAGEADESTRVFDPSLTRISQAREGLLERPAADAWHGKAFFSGAR